MTSHLFGTSILLSNKQKYQSWPDSFKTNLSNAIKKATKFQRKLAFDEDARCLEHLKEKGTKIQEMDKEVRMEMKRISLKSSLPELKKIPEEIQKKFFITFNLMNGKVKLELMVFKELPLHLLIFYPDLIAML